MVNPQSLLVLLKEKQFVEAQFIYFPIVAMSFAETVGLKACTSLKKEALTQVFSCESVKFLKAPFYIEQFWWLLP